MTKDNVAKLIDYVTGEEGFNNAEDLLLYIKDISLALYQHQYDREAEIEKAAKELLDYIEDIVGAL